jgi:hypothetical protein
LRWISPAAYKDIYRGETLKRSVPRGLRPRTPDVPGPREGQSYPTWINIQTDRKAKMSATAQMQAYIKVQDRIAHHQLAS